MSLQHRKHPKSRIEDKILSRVKQTAADHAMFQAGDAVLAAVSGGPDSVALVHILYTLAPQFSFRLAIAHLNHCLRPKESERDADFVASLARTLGLACYMGRKNVNRYRHRQNLSLEEAARRVRYDFLNHIADSHGFNKIALGHHCDDNAELMLMVVLRGSGPLGLGGIPPVRDGNIVRPLINVRRSDLFDYISQKKIAYVCDSSNADLKHLRNKVRRQLIPLLKSAYNPNISESLNQLAAITRAEEEWIAELITPIFENTVTDRQAGKIVLSLARLEPIPAAARRRVIRKAIFAAKGDLRRITFCHVEAANRMAMKGPVLGFLDLPDRIRIERSHQVLIVSREGKNLRLSGGGRIEPECRDYEYQIPAPGMLHIKEAGVHLNLIEIGIQDLPDFGCTGQQVAFFDMNMLRFPLIVRNFRPGDRFSPLGLTGTQKLKSFFINNKIQRAERIKCPLLVSRGKIIWVGGHRLDNAVKVSAETRRVLKAELLLA